jgi:1-acyl-sn-glycerol-3-phosphate acyltransferase
MNKKNIPADRYCADDLPPIRNFLLYTYRVLIKLFLYIFFGTGSAVLAVIVFPLIKLFVHPRKKFQTTARAVVSQTFRFFLSLMRCLGVIRFHVENGEQIRSLKSKIIVANHPSIIDVVFIISLVPNADCIVRGSLAKTILAGVIRQLYIVNSLDYKEMVDFSKKSLNSGTNLIIFPEGTRTPRHGTNSYKKGAARIALDTGCNIQPLYIGGNDKYGLGKYDAFFSYNHTERYFYEIHLLPEIKTADYLHMEPQIAAKRLTDKIHKEIADAAFLLDNRVV